MAIRRKALLRTMMIFDLIVMVLAFGIVTWGVYQASGVSANLSFDSFLSLRVKISNIMLVAAVLWCWNLIFIYKGMYRSHRLSSVFNVALDISIATFLASLVAYLMSLVFDISLVSPSILVAFWLTSTAILIASRLALRFALKQIRLAGRNLRHVAVVGTNAKAREYVNMIKSTPELGYRFIGFIDDSHTPPHNDIPIVANYDEFADFVRGTVVDEIVVFSPLRSQYDKIAGIVAIAEAQGIILRFAINPFSLKIGRSVVDQIGDVAVSSVQTGSMHGNPSMGAKAALDFLLALVALVWLSPLFLIVATMLKWESPKAPVLFVQQRLGLNKRLFNIYKFRTMREDAEKLQAGLEQLNEADGPVFKIKNDPRITPLGKWLRKTSIDELPQLLNVLKGDMSLVGPRPLPVRDFQGFDNDPHRRRFSVKPGITCLWQISGRSNISFEKWMELDMNYIDHWSFWLDLKILLKTIPAVLNRTGAE